MSDDSFIREVEEELRNERLQNIWQRYGKLIIAAAVAVVVAVAGYRYYEYSNAREAATNGDAFMEAVRLAEENKAEEAVKAFEAIQADGSVAYKAMARLRTAAELVKSGNKDEAVALYDAIAEDNSVDVNLRSVARVRAGMVLVDTGSVEDVQQRVQPLTAPDGAYRSSAREALGLANFKAGKFEEAYKYYEALDLDVDTPANMRQRTTIMLDLIAARGGPVRTN